MSPPGLESVDPWLEAKGNRSVQAARSGIYDFMMGLGVDDGREDMCFETD
jgi:hypothetical protein